MFMWGMTRRRFLMVSGELSLVAASGSSGLLAVGAVLAAPARVDSVPTNVTRTWLAPQYWANRLADWRLNAGRIECLTAGRGGRTVGVLTRSIAAGNTSGSIVMRTGTLVAGAGFSGFVVGTGAGELDWRAAALVMGASGQGGGFLAIYDSDGQVRFREHTDESNQFGFAVLPSTARSGPQPARTLGEDVTLRLDITSTGSGRFDLTLTARTTATGALLSTAKRVGVPDSELVGGLSLISSTRAAGTTARHWMRELQTDGPKLAVHNRAAGPVLGTLFSLSGSVLKMTAQFMPVGSADPQQATLQTRLPGAPAWTTVQTATIEAGYVALFRVSGWDSARDWEYRVVYAAGTAQWASYTGHIPRNPTAKAVLSVAMINCTIHSHRNLDVPSSGAPKFTGETFSGLYTTRNLYFPYAELVGNIQQQGPDLLVAFGDQYYEHKPTVVNQGAGILDVLSRYYLWLWSFEQITRNTPTICLVDDHDVYQTNLWGWSGRAAPEGDYRSGGYIMPAGWVNTVQRIQCAHNPDAHDPATVLQGITVYYSAFSYGGVSFAVLEDRKFKNTNASSTDPNGNPGQLLGPRQESFLRAWASMHLGQPKVCLTQTVFATVTTNPFGSPQFDPDSNGAPVPARRTALTLLKNARAVVLSGDQHLATLVRHGINQFTDGPLQFTAPAAGTAWQRWFTPASALPNASGPNTGDFTDGFGNKVRVLAVANPKVSFAEVRAVQPGGNHVGDRDLKRDGYGIARIDKVNSNYRFECWPWQTNPTSARATQYAGWPYTLPFDLA
jgi:alkaline phosphatase D